MYEKSIKHFVAANHEYLQDYFLLEEHWNNIKLLAHWLEIFWSATTQMSSTSVPMISTTHAIFWGLQDKLKGILRSLPNTVSADIKAGLLEAHQKLSDYFTKFDESPFYTWSASMCLQILICVIFTHFHLFQFWTLVSHMMSSETIMPMILTCC